MVFLPGYGKEDADWLYPALVYKIEYMGTSKTGSLRQPVFRRLWDEKPEDCVDLGEESPPI